MRVGCHVKILLLASMDIKKFKWQSQLFQLPLMNKKMALLNYFKTISCEYNYWYILSKFLLCFVHTSNFVS
jgi:hypothetical protein